MFFFFKQKTAYGMRISDWSSDVCSSDLSSVPLGHDAQGRPVLLRDIWPAPAVIAAALAEMPRQRGRSAPYTPARWNSLPVQPGPQFAWQDGSTFLCPPPFFERQASAFGALPGARPLLGLGADLTTEPITPVGPISPQLPAEIGKRAG